MMNNRLLIIFYRNPLLGQVKTRLAATMGDGEALAVYLKLAAHTRQVTMDAEADKRIYYSEYVDTEDAWPNDQFEKHLQEGNDLGQRMLRAFQSGFESGYQQICIIGTDCLEITTGIINSAFGKLDMNEVVIGPASDGGYYLMGLKEIHEKFFTNKSWSSDGVLKQTLDDINNLKISYSMLEVLNDIDKESDLPAQLRGKS